MQRASAEIWWIEVNKNDGAQESYLEAASTAF